MATKKKSIQIKIEEEPARFVKLDDDGQALPLDSPQWSQVLDPTTNLIWPRRPIGEYRWADINAAATACRLGNRTDWIAPAIQQQLSIVDYGRFEPAFDTRFFTLPKFGWLWTRTPDASARSVLAWDVHLYYGYSNRSYQGSEGLLLVCRSASASQ